MLQPRIHHFSLKHKSLQALGLASPLGAWTAQLWAREEFPHLPFGLPKLTQEV
jgi:hypothetical protein